MARQYAVGPRIRGITPNQRRVLVSLYGHGGSIRLALGGEFHACWSFQERGWATVARMKDQGVDMFVATLTPYGVEIATKLITRYQPKMLGMTTVARDPMQGIESGHSEVGTKLHAGGISDGSVGASVCPSDMAMPVQ